MRIYEEMSDYELGVEAGRRMALRQLNEAKEEIKAERYVSAPVVNKNQLVADIEKLIKPYKLNGQSFRLVKTPSDSKPSIGITAANGAGVIGYINLFYTTTINGATSSYQCNFISDVGNTNKSWGSLSDAVKEVIKGLKKLIKS